MNHLVASSVMKRVVTRGRFSSFSMAENPFNVLGAREQTLGFPGGWGRWMTAAATEPSSAASGTEKKGSHNVEMENVEKGASSSYWGMARPKITKEDGTEWVWNCFMPWETYHADLSIDLKKHHVPKKFVDKVAYRTVKLLRIPTDLFFKVFVE